MNKYFIMLQICSAALLAVQGQNVGIGINTPIEKLHVAGNIKTDTVKPTAIKFAPNAGTGKVLTSDAEGNANWQNNNNSAPGNIGFGVWGDCAANGNISEYQPAADTSVAANDNFGYSVAVSGNFAIVGSQSDDVGANTNQGSAIIYQHNGSSWVLMQKLTDPDGAAGDFFGYSVSMSGNYAVVGAYQDDVGLYPNQGSVSVYFYNGSSWVFIQKLADPDGAPSDFFGYSVSISGNYVLVGAQRDDIGDELEHGSAFIYQFNGTNWVLMQQLTDPAGMANDYFGNSVAISGNYAIVGNARDDVGANGDQGSASFYRYNGSNWIWMQTVTDATGASSDLFGYSVSISDNYAIVGVNSDDIGSNMQQGSANIYRYNGTSWVLMQKLTDPAGSANDYFGNSVAISGNYAIVGAYGDSVERQFQGSATIYFRVGMGWQKLQYVTDPGANEIDFFGLSIGFDGTTKRFLIGAYGYANSSGKVVFGKVN